MWHGLKTAGRMDDDLRMNPLADGAPGFAAAGWLGGACTFALAFAAAFARRALACLCRWLGAVALLGAVLAGPAAAQPAVQLAADTLQRDLWDAALVLDDPEARLTLTAVLANPEQFKVHAGQRGNLGRRAGAVWLRVPLRTAGDAASSWALELDYAPLDRIDVYLFEAGTLRQLAVLGDHVDVAERPWPSRAHVLPLELPPGRDFLLLLRVQSTGSMLFPARLAAPRIQAAGEASEQALQALLAGMVLCLLIYTVSKWLALRDGVFGWYALTLLGTAGFFAALSGVGPQHVWGGSTWLTRNGPPLFILVGVCGAFFFVLRALDVARTSPIAARITRACGLLAGATAVGLVAGRVDYGQAQAIGMALGPTPLLLVLPTAWQRWRGGDRAALYVLLGWGVYSLGVVAIVGLLAGALPVNFWTLHGFQFGSMLEMSMWMMVLAHRVHEIRTDATRVRHEREQMRSLAHSDMLTGLLNRRGLEEAVPPRLAAATEDRVVAVYLLDLDGFKQVNDSLGHGCGDELLQGVAQRLRRQVRADDQVCRLGGDEFVICVAGLAADEVARMAGKILRCFDEPFAVGTGPLTVAATIGCATAPRHGRELGSLLKHADQALYRGKAAGKRQVWLADQGAALGSP